MEYEREDNSVATKVTYLVVGGAIGAVLALLFAPKSGQELREDLAEAGRKGLEKGRETAAQIQERAGEYYEVGRERATELRGKAGELYENAQARAAEFAEKAKATAAGSTNPISAAIEAGKDAYVAEKRKNEAKAITEGRPSYPVDEEELELNLKEN